MSPPRYGRSEHAAADEGMAVINPRPRLSSQVKQQKREASTEKSRSHTSVSSSVTSSVITSRSFNSSESRHTCSGNESIGIIRSEGRTARMGGPVRGRPATASASARKQNEDEVVRRRQERKARSARLLSDLDERQHHRRSSVDSSGVHKTSSSERGRTDTTNANVTLRSRARSADIRHRSREDEQTVSDNSSSRFIRTYSNDSKEERRDGNNSQRLSSVRTGSSNDRVHLRPARRAASMGHVSLHGQSNAKSSGADANPPSETSTNTLKHAPHISRRSSMDHHRSDIQAPATVATGNEQPQPETENNSGSSRMLQVLRRASMQHTLSFRRLSISNQPPPVQELDTSQKFERRDSTNSTSSFLSLKEETLPPRSSRHDPNSSFRRASLESEQCEPPPPTAPTQRHRTWGNKPTPGSAIFSRLGQGFRQETEAAEEIGLSNSDDASVASARSTNTSPLPSRRSSILSGLMSNLDQEEEAPSSSASFFVKKKSIFENATDKSNVSATARTCSGTSLPCLAATSDSRETSTDSGRWMIGLKSEATLLSASSSTVPLNPEEQLATASARTLAETSADKVNEVKQIGASICQSVRSSIYQMAIPEVGSTYEVDVEFESNKEKLTRTDRSRRRHSSFMEMVTNISSETEKAIIPSETFTNQTKQQASMRARNADPSIGDYFRPTNTDTSTSDTRATSAFAAAAESMREDKPRGTSSRSKPVREEMRVFNPNNSKDDIGKELWDSGTFQIVDGLITLAHPDESGKEHHPAFNFL